MMASREEKNRLFVRNYVIRYMNWDERFRRLAEKRGFELRRIGTGIRHELYDEGFSPAEALNIIENNRIRSR